MKVSTLVTVEIKGQRLELTHAEAQELLGALAASMAAPLISPPSLPWTAPWPQWPQWQPYVQQPYYYDTPPCYTADKITVTCNA